jgi:hypothetical protein
VDIEIKESAITNFDIIYQLDETKQRLDGYLVDLAARSLKIVNTFYTQTEYRPLLKKRGIHVNITVKQTSENICNECCQRIVSHYIRSIGWDDLQHIVFISNREDIMEIDVIFNRVVSSTEFINIKALKPSRKQYKILHHAIEEYRSKKVIKLNEWLHNRV